MDNAPLFAVHNDGNFAAPVLLSVPHAGRDYPPELLAQLRVQPADLQRLEDRYADRLVQPAVADGFAAIIAHRARAWIDLNRSETDFDAEMLTRTGALAATPSAKTRGGLGLIPRRLQGVGDLWRGPMTPDAMLDRVARFHRPYHHRTSAILSAMRVRHGTAVLLDIHSMPPIRPRFPRGHGDPDEPQIVIGDRFGRSAASLYAELVQAHLRARGYRVALNAPYAGDHILQTHGKPARNIHALQLEIDRSLYLDADLRDPGEGIAEMAALIRDIALVLADTASGVAFAEAAE